VRAVLLKIKKARSALPERAFPLGIQELVVMTAATAAV
jgi:hypothetical protein